VALALALVLVPLPLSSHVGKKKEDEVD